MHTAHYLQQFSLAIQDNRIDEALTITLQWQETQPDAMAFACEAMLHRKQNELRHAKKAIEKGLTDFAQSVFLLQEKALVEMADASFADAKQTLDHIISINAYFVSAWQQLWQLTQSQAALFVPAEQAKIEAQLRFFSQLPKPLLQCYFELGNGNIKIVENIVKETFVTPPVSHKELSAWLELAQKIHFERYATVALKNALQKQDEPVWHIELAKLYQNQENFYKAQPHLLAIAQQMSEHPQYQITQAVQLFHTNQVSEAIGLLEGLLSRTAMNSAQGRIYLLLGQCYQAQLQIDKAAAVFRQTLAFEHLRAEAYWHLANLKTHTLDNQDIDELKHLTHEQFSTLERSYAHFALAMALTQQDAFSDAFAHLQQANVLQEMLQPWNAQQMADSLSSLREANVPKVIEIAHHSNDVPIFIIGLPRSGSTLLDQMLATHPDIDGTKELSTMLHIAQDIAEATGKAFHQTLSTLTDKQKATYRAWYLGSAEPFREGAPYFIDKNPDNFKYVSLILTLFPEAKIIDLRRDPRANGLSAFRHRFAKGHAYSQSLKHFAEYYKSYINTVEHWTRHYPTQIQRVDFEALVKQPSATLANLCDFIGVDTLAEPMAFQTHQRNIYTPSAAQVLQPLDRTKANEWEHYKDYLGPLLNL